MSILQESMIINVRTENWLSETIQVKAKQTWLEALWWHGLNFCVIVNTSVTRREGPCVVFICLC